MFAKSRQDTLYIIHTEYNWGICEQEIQEIQKTKKNKNKNRQDNNLKEIKCKLQQWAQMTIHG